MKLRILLIVICLTITNIGYAQFNPMHFRPQFNPFASCNSPSNYAEQVFTRVLSIARQYAQVPILLFCQNDFVPNAYAQMYGQPQQYVMPNGYRGTRMIPVYRIDYNPNFMGQADVTVNNNFALIGVLAHEIGHIEHFSHIGNPMDPQSWQANFDLNVPWEKELRADEFAGYVLAKMGASIEDVIDTQRTIFSLHVNPQYADSVTRLRRMFEGYKSGKNGQLSQEEINKVNSVQNIAKQYLRWR